METKIVTRHIIIKTNTNTMEKNTPKFRLIKEVNHVNNDTYYWTVNASGNVVDNSMTKDYPTALRIYEIICKNGTTVTRTTINEYNEA